MTCMSAVAEARHTCQRDQPAACRVCGSLQNEEVVAAMESEIPDLPFAGLHPLP